MPYACRWAQLPSEVLLAVCQRLSARHLKELKDNIKLDANHIGRELDSWELYHSDQGHHPWRARERVRLLENLL